MNPELASEYADALGNRGIRILRNESHEVAGLTLVGLDDLWTGRFHPSSDMAGADLGRPCLVLSHTPDTEDLPGWSGYQGWVLAGHTRGVNATLPFLPPPILPVRNSPYAAGQIDVGSGRRLYVSRGVGHLIQVRFNMRPEVTVSQRETA